MARCITGAKFTMRATLLRKSDNYNGEGATDSNFIGGWTESQDPLTGEIVRVWAPVVELPDNPNTPEFDPSTSTINCVARGYSTSNRFTSTQVFGDVYKNIDVVRMWTPTSVFINKGDRVTNIRTPEGTILWVDDYSPPQATQFNVIGATPQIGPFNKHTENFIMLERAEVA